MLLEQEPEIQGDQKLVLDDQCYRVARPSLPDRAGWHGISSRDRPTAERDQDLASVTRRRKDLFR